ncbi:unnamed protein product [Meloidogyne enterolobii]|uniref:Uncharacterized protein n=1 Tax=Meloidogyne enterolobii TaxID=390850 RepID=A0ACB0ZFI4_MELEN
MSQLRYILGTGFEQLLVEDKSLSKDVDNDIGFIIKSKILETVLKDRLNKLIEHVNKQKGNHEENLFLEIMDETEIIGIDLTQEKPLALSRKSGNKFTNDEEHKSSTIKNNSSIKSIKKPIGNFNKWLKIDRRNFNKDKNKMKNLEGESEAYWKISFDVFFCVDSDNDNISNKFLGTF